jgi:F-type H+-transporting ATPase subunit a
LPIKDTKIKKNFNVNISRKILLLSANEMYITSILSPLDQFEIRNLLSLNAPILGNLSISLTNIGLYLTIGALLVLTLNVLSTNYNKVVSNT